MLIKREVLDKIKSGEISLQFRRWRRRTVKAGGTLKTAVGVLQIGEITPIAADDVTEADARRAGFSSVAEFHIWLDTMKPGELDRIEVSYKGEDPRVALRDSTALSDADVAGLRAALEKIDAGAKTGWSAEVLRLIADNEGVLAETLALWTGEDKAVFKTRVRKLKELGLTESLETGYRISPRGKALLARLG
ncbi:hypothetical protein [Pelagibacterium xiamenense]|uniref:hypothetical protein n=1 Tax=Pelagibacterium xiamenense TaxID=2901140 RepID=UPI001E476603|nr:hypothetical protein [Pelagibacterium xiamenense]MCD7059944.1 hypothetical protein [Pelagibacterium xiamenense]